MDLRSDALSRRCFLPVVLVLISCLAGIAAIEAGPRGDARSDPAPWYVFYQKGVQAMVNDQWEEAADLFKQAIKERQPSQSPNRTYGMWQVDYVPHYNLAVCYFYLGRDPQALQALERSEALGETPPDGSMHQKIQRIRRAIQGAPSGSEGSRDTHLMAEGLSLLLAGGSDRAVEVFQDLLSGREDDTQIHFFLGLAYAGNASRARGDGARFWHNLARTEFRRARQLSPRLKLPAGFFAPQIETLFKEAGAR